MSKLVRPFHDANGKIWKAGTPLSEIPPPHPKSSLDPRWARSAAERDSLAQMQKVYAARAPVIAARAPEEMKVPSTEPELPLAPSGPPTTMSEMLPAPSSVEAVTLSEMQRQNLPTRKR